MKVCYFGTYRDEYSRNINMIAALKACGVEVEECHVRFWHGIEDRVSAASGGWRKPSFWFRVFRTYFKLLQSYWRTNDYDVMVIGYPGQLDVFLGYWLSRYKNKPLVWDVFMSIYLIALERNLDKRSPTTIRLLHRTEKLGLNRPNLLIQDTQQYVDWFVKTYDLSANNFRLVPTGADNRIFKPAEFLPSLHKPFRVTYYGTFIPNHGIHYILEAADQLKQDTDINFELIGQGPDRMSALETVREKNINNIKFIDWMDREDLVQHVATTDICLGAFGTTPQSLMTVQNKIFEGLAMKLPVITGDSETMRHTFEHKTHLYLVSRSDPTALAHGILELKNDQKLRERIASTGYSYFQENFSIRALGEKFKGYLEELIES